MTGIARARFARYSARKVWAVLPLVARKTVAEAMANLDHCPRQAAVLVKKTLWSAVKNARPQARPEDPPADLFVRSAWVGVGPKMRRWRAGPRGMPMPYSRKMCHFCVAVTDERQAGN